ncbi:hypothetical protein LCGC14_1491510 [marine sediment metagenome]|uniref:Uncharacterized protein n=2 Tax=root TaxID=1 RepID=A0A831R1D7_9GAMM|nr:hypothetical protein [Marinobacter antarcticus]HEA52312.1 hypothetical protein [Marinobacter antarcticus]
MKIQFVGNSKTGQDRYRGSTSLVPNLVCRLDQPQTCTLEAGVHLTDNEALRLLTQYPNLFISHESYLANLAAAAKPKNKPKGKPKKAANKAQATPKAAKPKKASKPKPAKKPASKAKSGGK